MRDANRPLAFFANGIGDSITTLPALRALSEIFAGRLRLACDRWAWETLFWDVGVRQHFEIDSRYGDGTREFDVEAAVRAARGSDLFLAMAPWHSGSMARLLERLDGASTVGYYPGFDRVIPLDFEKHTADLTFDLPRLLSPRLRLEDFAQPPRLPRDAEEAIDQLLGVVPEGAKLLFVHAETGATKRWLPDRFAQTIDAFLDRHPDYLVFNVARGTEELPGLRRGEQVVPFFGRSLPVCFALAGRCDLFLGVDSCFLHAADFARVPGVGLFGPTNPEEFGFRLARHRHVGGSGDMSSVSIAAVLEALEELRPDDGAPRRLGLC